MNRLIISILALSLAYIAQAQEEKTPSDLRKTGMELLSQQYSRTRNAAGMGLFQPESNSFTTLGLFSEKGDYHRAQEGDSDRGFSFSSTRYDSFSDKLFMSGSFSYTLDKETNRKWSDVIDPYYSIPFIYGSSVAKDYGTHDCLLNFNIYSAPLSEHFSLGMKVEYEVMDIYGNRDPRPRSGYLEYKLVPSVLFSAGAHHIGLDAGFTHEKEKLQNLTTIQSYPNLYYYKMSGLDRIDGAISAYTGFKRQFIANGFLSDLSYSYVTKYFQILVSGGAEGSLANAYGDKKQSPGSYNELKYNVLMDIVVNGSYLRHHFLLDGSFTDGGADEYLQELKSEKDPETGITTETWETLYVYKNIYMLKKTDLRVAYELYGACSKEGYCWSAGAELGYSSFDKECHLPYSHFGATGIDAGLKASFRAMERRGHKLDFDASCTLSHSLRSELSCYSSNIYVDEVLSVDREYHAAAWNRVRLGAEYTLPLKLGKAGMANGYLRLEWSRLKASIGSGLDALTCTVGLFTF